MFRSLVLTLALFLATATAYAQTPTPAQGQTDAQERTQNLKAQPRPHGSKVTVDPDKVRVDDGDTVNLNWGPGDVEVIRILGIDTPEIAHPEHDLPYPQSFGYEARGFAMGAFGSATKIELLRSTTLDPYGRTLGYLFVNGRNYSALIVKARFAEETVSHYGDNGFPAEAAEVVAAAKAAGPMPFEPPFQFRRRMRDVSKWMKDTGARAY